MVVPRKELRQAIAAELARAQKRARARLLDPDWAWQHLNNLIRDREEVAALACGGHVPLSYPRRAETTYLLVGVVDASAWVVAFRGKARYVRYGRNHYVSETTWSDISSYLPSEDVDSLARALFVRYGYPTPSDKIVYFKRVSPTAWYVVEHGTPYVSIPSALIPLQRAAQTKRKLIRVLRDTLRTTHAIAKKILAGELSEEELAILVLAL